VSTAAGGSTSTKPDRRPIGIRRRLAARGTWQPASRWLCLGFAALTWLCGVAADAGHVRLKNGLVLTGKPAKLISLTHLVDPNPGPTTIYKVVMVQTGYQRYFVPFRQVPDDGLNLDADLIRDVEFEVPQVRSRRELVVRRVGGVIANTPFDPQFGRRTVTLVTPREQIFVVQGITKITPEYVAITSTTHVWDFGVGLSQIPEETIVSILQNPLVCDPQDPQARLARARFYIQAGWYPQADAELVSCARDFPDLQDKAAELREQLRQLFGRHALLELERRRDAGQYRLADDYAQRLLNFELGGGVQRNVQQFLLESRAAHETLAKVSQLLSDLQAELDDPELSRGVSALRSQLMRELDRNGLPRLQPFLQAEQDPQLAPEEKLALAFSGWVLGPDAADLDWQRAQQLWEARELVREYLRAESPSLRTQLFERLTRLEGLGTQRMQRLLALLPPVRDAEGVAPGVPTAITVSSSGETPATTYWVQLPPEYSVNRNYPCVVALHSGARTAEKTIEFWGGTADEPGWCQRRGYIVIAPEYLPPDTHEYTHSLAAHTAVLQALRDARLRFAIDPDRVFLAGHDLGADAAFDIGLSHPDEFAGVIPIAGVVDAYGTFYLENGTQTAWYIVRGELGRDHDKRPVSVWLDRAFTLGAKFDLIYVVFSGRGQDTYADELPRIFDWMDLHRRGPPPKEFEFRSLRQSDNNIHWVTALDLPKTVLLQASSGDRVGTEVMLISGRVNEGNTLSVKSPARRHRIRLLDGVVDFDRKITVTVNGRSRYSKFVAPDVLTLLEEFRLWGDRRRIAAAVLEF